jgi:hypothetical protein
MLLSLLKLQKYAVISNTVMMTEKLTEEYRINTINDIILLVFNLGVSLPEVLSSVEISRVNYCAYHLVNR